MPQIFEYQQYREYLKDFYQEQKAVKSGFTYARFSEKAQLGSPNYYKLVMDGEKNLTGNNIIRFCQGLGLQSHEADYFEALVQFNQADEVEIRKHYQDRLTRLKTRYKGGELSQRTIEEYEFEVMSSWVHHAVMVLTQTRGFRESPIWIAQKLFGLVTEQEVTQILESLQALGLLTRDSGGKLKQSHKQVRTRPDLKRQAGRAFYEGLFSRVAQSMKMNSPDDRELGAYLVCFSKPQLPELRKRVREFMSSLNEWALSHQKPEHVYALVFGGVPLTQDEDSHLRNKTMWPPQIPKEFL